MTAEEKNELYEKAFKCIFESLETDNEILAKISAYETQYDFLEFQRSLNVISQDEVESYPHLTLDQIAELKARDHSNIHDFLKSETTFQELVKDTIDVKSKQDQVFENLKKAIEGEKGILEKIKALSRKRVVAITGKNYELISGIITYLWLTHPYNGNNPAKWLLSETPIRQYFCSLVGKYIPNRIPFVYGNCNGLDVKETKNALYFIQHELENCSKQSKNVRLQGFELRSSVLQGVELKKMAFLRDINCNAGIEALNTMVGMIKDGLLPKEDVVVSTDNLPKELLGRFEVIELEAVFFAYNWSFCDDKQEIYCNGSVVIKLSDISYELFKCLLSKKGKFVNTKTLEKYWFEKPQYDKFLVDKMCKLKNKLKNELTKREINIQGEIIESRQNDKRKIIAYKLPT
jgi:hypothetical protein